MEELNHASGPSEPPVLQDESPADAGAASWEDQLEESLSAGTLRRGELREGVIIECREDGFLVGIGAKRDGFVPIEDLQKVEDREFNVGDTVPVVVTRFRDSEGNVELSISEAILQEDWLTAEKLLEDQSVYETVVTGANRGGLTVEFGRLRGFVPMSQLIGFNQIRQPAERQRRLRGMVGQQIMVKVIEVNRRRRRLILSQRAAAREWRAARREKLLAELEPGQVRRGRISQVVDFGLFVNLGGIDGLVHISELSWGRIDHPREIYAPGQRIKVKVLDVDRDRERIALSIKALTPDPWDSVAERYPVGSLTEGRVTQVVDFGVFIELEPGVEGLLHNSELRDVAQREELQSGETVLVKIIRVEPDRRRVGLSVRQVTTEEWENWVLARIEQAEEAQKAAEEAQAAEAEAAAPQVEPTSESEPEAEAAEAPAVTEGAPAEAPEAEAAGGESGEVASVEAGDKTEGEEPQVSEAGEGDEESVESSSAAAEDTAPEPTEPPEQEEAV